MSITYSQTLANYNQFLQSFIKSVEDQYATPYVDSGDAQRNGVPTIGWGFALNSAHGVSGVDATSGAPIGISYLINTVLGVNIPNLQYIASSPAKTGMLSSVDSAKEANYQKQILAVLNQHWAPNPTYPPSGGQTPALNLALNQILQARAADISANYSVADQVLIGTPHTQFVLTVPQIGSYFNTIESTYDKRLNNFISSALPGNNAERIALFGMAYVGNLNAKVRSALYLSDSDDARAETWYTIRYTGSTGYAKRAYQEAAMFSLYGTDSAGNPLQTITNSAALATYRVFAENFAKMMTYDAHNANQLKDANNAMGNVGLVGVSDLTGSLQLAATELNQIYGHGQIYSALNIGVGKDSVIGASVVDFSHDTKNDLLIGGFSNDTLIGGKGTNAYDYILANTGTIQTIDNSHGTNLGFVYVGDTQLIGPGGVGEQASVVSAGPQTTWTVTTGTDVGTQYQFDSNTGKLTISNGLLGTSGQIIIDNFNMNQAQGPATGSGYLGLRFTPQIDIAAGAGHTNDLFDYDPTNAAVTAQADVQGLTFRVSEISDKPQTILVTLAGGDGSQFAANTGADLLSFNNNTVTLTIPAGADSVTVGLVYTGDPTQAQSVQLTSRLTEVDNSPASNVLGVTFDAQAALSPAPITGQLVSQQIAIDGVKYDYTMFETGDGLITAQAGGNQIDTHDGNSIINGSGALDVILTGDGNNQIYANTQIDLSTALANQRTATASGGRGDILAVGNGNNTIVGGSGNDVIDLGSGANVVVLGPGNVTLNAGVGTSFGTITQTANWNLVPNTDNGFADWGLGGTPSSTYKGTVLTDVGAGANDGEALGTGSDTIFGGKGDSKFLLANGNNYLDAGGGSDFILTGTGQNTIFGGAGNDTIYGQGGTNYINAESGNDYIVCNGGDSSVYGGSGNSTIYSGLSGSDWATSGVGGTNYIQGGTGNTAISGSAGKDTLVAGSGSDSIWAGSGDTTIYGGSGTDSIAGGAGKNLIYAGAGGGISTNDFTQIIAGSGATTVYGGAGVDRIFGGDGNNVLYAGDGGTSTNQTQITAGAGDTTIYGGAGVDWITGGSGNDVLYAGNDGGIDNHHNQVTAGTGNTTIYGGAGSVLITGGAGNNVLYAGDGGGGSDVNDFTQVMAGSGATTVYGGAGIDHIFGGAGSNILYAGDGGNDTSQTQITVGAGETTVYGGAGVDLIHGGSGADLLYAGDGGTSLTATQIQAGSGSDTLVAGAGNDVLFGGGGTATYVINANVGNVQIAQSSSSDTLAFGTGINPANLSCSVIGMLVDGSLVYSITTSGGGVVTVQGGGLTQVSFSDGNTTTLAQLAEATVTVGNTLYASQNSSLASTSIQNLTLTGYLDLSGTGNNLNNIITGNSGNDTLVAGSANDTLIGGAGFNTFIAGAGNDTIVAGNGGSNFIFNAGAGNATITQSLQSDTLQFGAGITAVNLVASTSAAADGSTIVTLAVAGGGSVVIQGNSTTGLLDQVKFADGTTTTLSQLILQSNPIAASMSSATSVAMPAGIVNLTLTGNAAVSATGNDLDDVITANSGNDTLIAGSGSDTLVGGGGTATYIASLSGATTIINSTSGDTLQFGAGVTAADLTVSTVVAADGTTTVMLVSEAGGSVTIHGDSAGALGKISFFDGSTATLQQLVSQSTTMFSAASIVLPDGIQNLQLTGSANLSATGNALNDVILANSGNDTLMAGSGNDTLIGGAGHNTFVVGTGNDAVLAGNGGSNFIFNAGAGNATITQSLQSDTLQFGAGITAVNLVASATAAADGSTIVTLAVAGGGSVVIQGNSTTGLLDQVKFADGTTTTLSQLILQSNPTAASMSSATSVVMPAGIINLTLTGNAAVSATGNDLDDVITANSGTNTLTAGSGNDTLIGGEGNNVFSGGSGKTTMIGGAGYNAFTARTGNDILIGGTGRNNFFAGSGNDTLISGTGTNNFTVGTGSDTFVGGNGISSFNINLASGNTTITHSLSSDTLQFGTGITAANLTASASAAADGSTIVTLAVAGGGSVVILGNAPAGLLNQLQFADGTATTLSQLLVQSNPAATSLSSATGLVLPAGVVNLTLTGIAAVSATGNDLNDRINGNSGNDTLIAGSGNDTLVAGVGSNTLIAGRGDSWLIGNGDSRGVSAGSLTTYAIGARDIAVIDSSTGNDILQFGAGVTAADLMKSITIDIYQRTVVTLVSNTGSCVTIYGEGYNGIRMLDTIRFADGTTTSLAKLVTQSNVGYSSSSGFYALGNVEQSRTGNESLIASSGIDTLIAGSGNNFMIGGTGYDTFISGTGNDTIVAGSGGSRFYVNTDSGNATITQSLQSDTLQFGAGITAVNLVASTSAAADGSTIVTLAVAGGGSVVIQGNSTTGLLDQVKFADGTTTTLSQLILQSNPIAASMSSATSVAMPAGIVNLTLTGNAAVSATGNDLDDVITANSGSDTLIASGGNDTMIAGSGDTLQFGTGIKATDLTVSTVVAANDIRTVMLAPKTGGSVTIQGDSSGNVLDKISFADGSTASLQQLLSQSTSMFSAESMLLPDGIQNLQLTGRANLSATGNALSDVITANSGNDTLIAGSGLATLIGGSGNDLFVVSNSVDVVQAQTGGTNTVQASVSYTAGQNVQKIIGTGTDSLVLTSTSDREVTLVAGSGLATLVGGGGDNIFVVNNTADVVQSNQSTTNTILTSVSFTADDYAQNLTGTGSADLMLTGGYGRINTITANSGNDTLIAGSSDATLVGGIGNDLFIVNDITDVVRAQIGGINTIQTSVSYTAGSNVANLIGTGTDNLTLTGNDQVNNITANGGNDTLVAGSGIATLVGGAGSDFFIINNSADIVQAQAGGNNTVQTSVSYTAGANVQNLTGTGNGNITLTGNSLNNVITGNGGADSLVAGSGNDTLISGSGMDTMVGGIGNDTFVVNSAAVVVQAHTGGINIVQTSVSYIAGANVANLTATGTGNLILTGNNLVNTLTANSGNDTLVAGSGVATLVGGVGNDTFIVNNTADVVQAKTKGTNTIQTSVNFTAGSNVKNLTGTGTDNIKLTGNNLANTITANSGNDTLVAGSGIATLIGGAGNDTFAINNAADVVQAHTGGVNTVQTSVNYTASANVQNLTGTGSGNLTLTGNDLNDVITANNGADKLVAGSGNDTLISGTGVDTLIGGAGNDTFVINNVSDVITEMANSGSNTELTSVSITLAANVQNLTGTGTAALTLTGNTLNNAITGNGGADKLVAGSGNDTLIAGSGIDTLTGGAGNDTFVINNAADVVSAKSGSNVNTINSSVSYTASANVQMLTGIGSAAITLTGNTLADTITGNSGNDTLIAGSGNDTLVAGSGIDSMTGGAGSDSYQLGNFADQITLGSGVSNINGGNGNYQIFGSSNKANDSITLGAGTDTLSLGSGNDTLINNGGADTVTLGSGQYGISNNGGTESLILSSVSSANSLWFRQSGQDLLMSVLGSTESVDMHNWFLSAGPSTATTKIALSGGAAVTDAGILKLVQAMAAFAPPTSSQLSYTTAEQTALAPVIAANWH